MAATNYTPIQLYHSSTATAAPSAGNLANGELAINITDGKLYYKDSGGVVQVIATKGAGTIGGSTTQIQYNNAGALAGSAAMTFNSGTNTVTLTTLNLTNALGATYGGTAQSAYTQGDILYSSATNTLSKLGIGTVDYILTSTGSVPQWSAPSSISVLTATNLSGGVAGSVPYQSAASTTTFLAIGAANRVMTSSGTAPQWVTSLTGLTGVSSSSITNTSLTSGRLVYSTTGGAQTDDADLTFNGTTLSAGGYSTTGLTTLVQTVKIGDSNFSGVAVFAPATPAKLYIGTGTVTDTTSAIGATNATGAVTSLAITPIAATNTSVTYTNAATLYIAGAPSAGTNVTITNPYSLYVAAGASYFGGDVTFANQPIYSGGTANGVMYLNGSKQITTGTALVFDGSTLTVAPDANRSFKLQSLGTYSMSLENPSADSGAAIQFKTNGTFLWSRGASDAMALTTTGLAVGTSSSITTLTVNGIDGITMQRSTANAFAPVLDYLKSRGTSASPAGVSDGDGLFLLRVAPYQGSTFSYLNAMTVEVDGAYTAGQNPPTRIIFYTNAANGSSTNRLQITSAGNVGIGTNNPGGTAADRQLSVIGSTSSQLTVSSSTVAANLGATSSIAYLQTTGAFPLWFYTSNVARAEIDSLGRVGFGTQGTTADRLLDMSFQGVTLDAGSNQFGQVLNPTYSTGVTATIFNLYTGPNLTPGTTVNNVYNLYLEGINAVGSTVNVGRWGLYQAGSSDNNYFAGMVRIGSQVTGASGMAAGTLQVGNGFSGITNTGSNATPTILTSGSLEFNFDGVSGTQRHGRITGTNGGNTGGAYSGGVALEYYAYDGVSTYQWYTGLSMNAGGSVNIPRGTLSLTSGVGYNSSAGKTFYIGAENADSVNNDKAYQWNIRVTGDANGQPLQFWRSARNQSDAQVAQFTSSGVFDIGTGSGAVGQIQFPATQVASSNANTLDDYEEGTWTPAIVTTNGNQSITYANQTGRYIKIGRLVKLSWYINTTTIVSQGTGTLRINGAPGFAPDSNEESPGSFWSSAAIVGSTLKTYEVGVRANNGSELLLLNNTNGNLLDTGSMTGGGYAIGQLVYITSA
jgi:hypothetical protein